MTLRKLLPLFFALAIACECSAASKPHVIAFGRWTAAKWPNATGEKLLDLRVRPLFVDTRRREYTTGNPHDLTDRLLWCAVHFASMTHCRLKSAARRAGNGNAEAGCWWIG